MPRQRARAGRRGGGAAAAPLYTERRSRSTRRPWHLAIPTPAAAAAAAPNDTQGSLRNPGPSRGSSLCKRRAPAELLEVVVYIYAREGARTRRVELKSCRVPEIRFFFFGEINEQSLMVCGVELFFWIVVVPCGCGCCVLRWTLRRGGWFDGDWVVCDKVEIGSLLIVSICLWEVCEYVTWDFDFLISRFLGLNKRTLLVSAHTLSLLLVRTLNNGYRSVIFPEGCIFMYFI